MANFDTLALNPGKNFLKSMVTSPFLKQHKSAEMEADLKDLEVKVKNGLRQINPKQVIQQIDDDLIDADKIGELTNFAESFAQNASENISNFAKDTLDTFKSKILNDVSQMSANVAQKMSSKVVTDVKDLLKEAIEQQTLSVEERLEILDEKAKVDAISKATEFLNEKISLISNIVGDTQQVDSTRIAELNRYIEQGPKFINSQFEKQSSSMKALVNSTLNEQYDSCKKIIDDWEENMSDALASKINTKLKMTIQREQKKVFDDIKKNLLVVKTEAHKVLQVAKLKIMAMLGVNLPI